MAKANCYGCGTDIEIAIWDDHVLSGLVVPFCKDCSEDVPEDTLWDVSEVPEEQMVREIPNKEELPLDDGEDYVVVNRREEEVEYKKTGLSDEERKEFAEEYNLDSIEYSPYYDLFVHDSEDEEAVEKGREEIKRRI